MSRYSENEDNLAWAEGSWNDGAEARIVAKEPITAGPSADVVGEWAAQSWKAGWADADMQIMSERAALRVWQYKDEWDADNCVYHCIKGADGEHIATVHSRTEAEIIIKAVAAYSEHYLA
jgi:hypothetical protein